MNRNKKKDLPLNYLLIFLLAEIIFHLVLPVKKLIWPPFNYTGVIIILFGIVINLWADGLFKKYQTTVKPDEKPTYLIKNGPFRISRHPMYLGMLSILLGAAILLGSIVAFIFPLIFFIVVSQKFIPLEEKNLVRIFGKEYQDYKKKTRKWI